MMLMNSSLVTVGLFNQFRRQDADAWLFRDDIGAPHGIKGYEE
jgi:hypothetical protein